MPRRQFYGECFEELIDASQMLDEEQLEWAQAKLEAKRAQFELDRENEVEHYNPHGKGGLNLRKPKGNDSKVGSKSTAGYYKRDLKKKERGSQVIHLNPQAVNPLTYLDDKSKPLPSPDEVVSLSVASQVLLLHLLLDFTF